MDWGALSILKASTDISWVALKKASKATVTAVYIIFLFGSEKDTIKINIIINNWEKINQPLRWPSFPKKGKSKLSIIGAQRYLNAYAKPAQLNSVTVLRSIPALVSQTDKVEKISSMGKPDEKPKKKIIKLFFLKNIDKFFFN